LKYLFEVEEEIKNCWFCPLSMIADYDDTKLHCKLIDKYINGDETPDDCPLQKVDDVLDELKENLEADKPAYFPYRHCGNCEHGNKYKEHEPCNSCNRLSNWKKRIFY
jgi:hypothetical protein